MATSEHSEPDRPLAVPLSDQLGALVPHLQSLRQCADSACDAAWHDESCKADAVNWGDFGCVGAEAYVAEDGTHGLRVLIEEADPGCVNVRNFVRDYLAKRGWHGVDVATEW